MRIAVVCAAFFLAHSALAQEVPVPKVFKGMQAGEKGRWQMEVLEGGGRARKGMAITLCTDNLVDQAAGRGKPNGESSCKHKLVKDTAEEAVVESECRERKSTVSLKRDGESMLVAVESTGPKGAQSMKMRATHLGPCRESQGPSNN